MRGRGKVPSHARTEAILWLLAVLDTHNPLLFGHVELTQAIKLGDRFGIILIKQYSIHSGSVDSYAAFTPETITAELFL